jgi:hypothetical protein
MRKRRYAVVALGAALFIAAGMLLATPQGASAAQGLSELQARGYADRVLHRHFKGTWDYGYAQRVRCGARLTPNKRRCRVEWIIGDLSFRGTVTIRDPGGQTIYYGFVIRKINHYCLATEGSDCVQVMAQ